MLATSEVPINLRPDDGQASPAQTRHPRRLSAIWNFLNSSFGLWFLSSVLLSAAVYFYQTWQDDKHQREITIQRVEQLNLEIAGRLSQFGTWARANLLQVDNKGQYQFSAGVNKANKAIIEKAIDDLAAAPKSPEPGNNLHLHEVFTEFQGRNLISLYVELNLIVQKALEEACNCSIIKNRENLGTTDAEVKPVTPVSTLIRKRSYLNDDDLHQLYIRIIQYKEAEVALLSPDYLFQYGQTPDHDVFIRSFEGIFLTDDAKRSGLPSTDCLENFPDGGACITYPKPMVVSLDDGKPAGGP
jgi:hypothetical protein